MAFQFLAYDLSRSSTDATSIVNRRLLREVDNPFHLAPKEFVKLYRLTPDIAEDLIYQLDGQLRGSRITAISTEKKVTFVLFLMLRNYKHLFVL